MGPFSIQQLSINVRQFKKAIVAYKGFIVSGWLLALSVIYGLSWRNY